MTQKHKHAELIHAWADGAKVQYRNGDQWVDVPRNPPYWDEDTDYRLRPHKWQHCIDAQKEGKVVQGRYCESDLCTGWFDIDNASEFDSPSIECRVKPERKVIRYRLYLWTGASGITYVDTHLDHQALFEQPEKRDGFLHWIGPWQEYEVPETGET